MSKTLLYSLAFIALSLSAGSLGPTLLALAAHTQAEPHQISYLFITRSLGTMLGSWLIRVYSFSGLRHDSHRRNVVTGLFESALSLH